jgi:hypothetical protein
VIWVCEPNISAVCPLSSPSLCFVYCHGWLILSPSCPHSVWWPWPWLLELDVLMLPKLSSQDWVPKVCVKIIRGEKLIKESAASKQHVLGQTPASFIASCSNAESCLDAEIWATDRLRPCQHISLMSPRYIFIVRLCARAGEQEQGSPTCFLRWFFVLQFNFIKHKVSHHHMSGLQ